MKRPSTIRLLSLTVAISLMILNSGAYGRMLQGAEVTVVGSGVKIEGASAATGATFMSGNRITTDLSSKATLTIGGSRVTVNEDTDATITFDGSSIRVNITCGSVSANSAGGTTYTVSTSGDTNVFVSSGRIKVNGSAMKENQTQRVTGTATIEATDAAAFDVTTALCTCKCLPAIGGVPAPVAQATGLGAVALAALIAGVAVAVIVPIVIVNNDNVSEELPGVSVNSF